MRVKRKPLIACVLLVLFSALLLLLTAQGQDESPSIPMEDPTMERQMSELQDRLRKSETLNRQREDELFALLARLQVQGNASQAHTGGGMAQGNTSNGSINSAVLDDLTLSGLQVPGIHSYLPHLSGHPDRLRPHKKISQGRQGVSIVIGVPTIKRDKASYLVKTLSSLITALNSQESQDCVIVLFIAEPWDQTYVDTLMGTVKSNFQDYLDSGLLEVITPPAGFYPDLNNLKETFGDPKERVKWRTKQNLDYAFLMLYARPKAMYYVQMEDDVIAKPGYLSIMKTFAAQQKGDWLMLEFSVLGFIGKMFKASDVPMIVEFFLMFHADKPIDWLLDHLLWVKVCNPEKDAKHCQRMIQAVRRRFKPSLFQHIGVESSLKGKVQKLKDKDFGKAGLYRAHVNPPVHLASSLKTYQKYTLSKAYTGETFFWASNPSKGDIIDFKFDPAINIEQYLFRSGNTDHPGDVFLNTTVEIKPVTPPPASLLETIASHSGLPMNQVVHASDSFIAIGRFNENGLAQGEVPEGVGQIQTMRLHIHEKSNAWVILSEIMIKEAKR